MKVKEFNEVGEVIAKHFPNVDKIELDAFTSGGYKYEYLVVTFRGGLISVRNAAANSLIANLQELALLLNGGYYREVEKYKKLKEADTLNEIK